MIKKISIFILVIVLLTSCTAKDISSISSSTSVSSSSASASSQSTISEETTNYSDKFWDLYKQYREQYNEKLNALKILFTTENLVRKSDIPVSIEKKDFIYESLPATIEKISNEEDGTVYQYVITITNTKSITKYIYYFDDNSFTYCQKIDLSYFTEEKKLEDLMRSKVYFYVQKQETDETLLIIDSIQICVPIEKKEIFNLDEMNDFFETQKGSLPSSEIILQNSLEEILDGYIDDISKSQEIYRNYILQTDTIFETLEKEYELSYNKQKKFSLESEENRNYVYSTDGFFEGTYLTRIENSDGTDRHYIYQTSAYSGEQFRTSYSVSDTDLYDESLFITYADSNWMYSNEKLPIFYSIQAEFSDSETNTYYTLIPELKVVSTYKYNGEVRTFAKIDELFDSYSNIVA